MAYLFFQIQQFSSYFFFQILMSVLRKPTTVVLMLFAIIPRVHTTAHANLDTMETELIAALVNDLFMLHVNSNTDQIMVLHPPS